MIPEAFRVWLYGLLAAVGGAAVPQRVAPAQQPQVVRVPVVGGEHDLMGLATRLRPEVREREGLVHLELQLPLPLVDRSPVSWPAQLVSPRPVRAGSRAE